MSLALSQSDWVRFWVSLTAVCRQQGVRPREERVLCLQPLCVRPWRLGPSQRHRPDPGDHQRCQRQRPCVPVRAVQDFCGPVAGSRHECTAGKTMYVQTCWCKLLVRHLKHELLVILQHLPLISFHLLAGKGGRP